MCLFLLFPCFVFAVDCVFIVLFVVASDFVVVSICVRVCCCAVGYMALSHLLLSTHN